MDVIGLREVRRIKEVVITQTNGHILYNGDHQKRGLGFVFYRNTAWNIGDFCWTSTKESK